MKLYNQDCLPAMKEMPDNAFDLAIVDPPYGIGCHKMFIAKDRVDPRNGRLIKCKRNKRGNWDSARTENAYFIELQRVSKNQIIWGGNYFADLLPAKSCWIIWDKVNGKSDQADCELAYTSFNSAVRLVHYMWHIAQAISIEKGMMAQGNNKLWERRIHPTQKPVALYKWLLTNYAKPGQTILDTHLGSGSSAIACDVLGFNLTAFEIDGEYIEGATDRLKRHRAQNVLDL